MTIKDYTEIYPNNTLVYVRQDLTITVKDMFKGTLQELRYTAIIDLQPKHFCISEDTLIITV